MWDIIVRNELDLLVLLIIALSRAAGVPVESLARAYNEVEDNKEILEQFKGLVLQEASDAP